MYTIVSKNYTIIQWPIPLASLMWNTFGNPRNTAFIWIFKMTSLCILTITSVQLFFSCTGTSLEGSSFVTEDQAPASFPSQMAAWLRDKREVWPNSQVLYPLFCLSDRKSYYKLCSSGWGESLKTWQRTDLFCFLFVIGGNLGLNFMRSENNS